MAYSLNRSQLIGNVTREPETRQTTGGQTVATFSVATNSRFKDKSGQYQDKAEFHNVVAWGKLAEICSSYITKGKKIYVEGRMQTRDWQGEDGIKRYKTEIVAENIILLDRAGAPTGEGGAMREQRTVRQEEPSGEPAEVEGEVALDDLPF